MAHSGNDECPEILEFFGNLRRESPGEMLPSSCSRLLLDEFKRCDRLCCDGNAFESLPIEWSDGCLSEPNVELDSLCEYQLL